jgi:hypothetical protein
VDHGSCAYSLSAPARGSCALPRKMVAGSIMASLYHAQLLELMYG